MEIKKIIDGLQFTIDMLMTNPATGEDIPPSDWDLETIKPKLLNGGKHDGN